MITQYSVESVEYSVPCALYNLVDLSLMVATRYAAFRNTAL